jgi:hypothetical protein
MVDENIDTGLSLMMSKLHDEEDHADYLAELISKDVKNIDELTEQHFNDMFSKIEIPDYISSKWCNEIY